MWKRRPKLFAVVCSVSGIMSLLAICHVSPLVSYHVCKLSSLLSLKSSQYLDYSQKCEGKYFDFHEYLNKEQRKAVDKCISLYSCDLVEGLRLEIEQSDIRYTSHSYLNNTGFIIEAGGHLGVDVSEFNSRYHPKTYIVLEPVVEFYKHLKQRFNNTENIILLNYGLGVEDGEFNVDIDSDDGTSIFHNNAPEMTKGDRIRIISVSKFFDKKFDERDVDLLTINCEGCEFAILDYLLSTGKINRVKNIQFQSHVLPGICQPIRRICWYQELLQKTHKLVYQFKFNWESWTRL